MFASRISSEAYRLYFWSFLLQFLVFPFTILCGDHDDLASQFGSARELRSWDEAYSLAKTFVSQLTTSEKISLTTGTGIALGPCSGNTAAVNRLGFRNFCLQDGPAGIRGVDFVSVFPAGITTAATWDRELIYLRSRAHGVENRIKGVNVALAPVGGPIGRAPAAGRNWEGFGPDQYLCGIGNAESVKGLQDEGVIACAKHFIGNEQERFRLVIENLFSNPIFKSISSNIEERILYEIYGWPFIDAVEAGAGSVMCSYQRVNGEYSCESTTLLRNLLKSNSSGGMNFRGFVVTDWFASAAHNIASGAGVDMVMPGDIGLTGTAAALMPASDGALSNGTRLDEMVTRTLAAWYKMRQDEGVEDISFSSWSSDDFGILLDRFYIGTINYHVPANSSLHSTLIRRIAAEGTILLKNVDNALPLTNSTASIGVFGNDAGPIPGGPNSCGSMMPCAFGTLAVGWGSGSGTFPYLIDPLQAIEAKANETGILVESVLDDYAYDEMREKAVGKEVCLAFINSRSGEMTNVVEGNAGDRNNLTAWRDGDTLVKTVASSCSNTIVVIHSVGAIIMEPWIEHPNVTAIVLAHLPGQESGNSLVDVLWGVVNPSAKLPYTIAKKEEDYCCRVQYNWSSFEPEQNFTEGLLTDYRWFDSKGIEPRYEFGFGLSYTNFTYDSSTFTITSPRSISSTDFLEPLFNASIKITNTGEIFGKEIAQLYISYPDSTSSPINQLRGFVKLSLEPGEAKTAEFMVTKRDVSYWDVDAKEWVVKSGEAYRIWVGSSSRQMHAEGTITFS